MFDHIVIYSGGMDSFTLLHEARARAGGGGRLKAISFDYGQRHAKELLCAAKVAGEMGIEHIVLDLSGLSHILKGSALTTADIDVPLGHYSDSSMKKTVVPGRNTLMISMAMAWAESLIMQATDYKRRLGDAEAHHGAMIYYGAHQGDHAIYPDCRAKYVQSMNKTIHAATDGLVRLAAPFILMDKAAILAHGAKLGLTATDYANTWTCYQGGENACGKCGSCNERLEAFAAMGWEDPAMAWTKKDEGPAE